jgi:hypothetical protein
MSNSDNLYYFKYLPYFIVTYHMMIANPADPHYEIMEGPRARIR